MLAKDIADSARNHNSLWFVLSLYVLNYRRLSTLVSDTGIFLWAEQNFPQGVDWLEMLLLEMLVNIACAHLKLKKMKGVCFWVRHTHTAMEKLCGRIDAERISTGIRAYYVSLMLWAFIYSDTTSSITVGDLVYRLRAIGNWPHQKHDLSIIERHPDHKAVLTKEILPLDQCSISHLPCPATSFYKTIEGLKQSMRYKGWHNVECIRSLDKDTKKTINDLQRKYGLQVTDFDLLHVGFDPANEEESP